MGIINIVGLGAGDLAQMPMGVYKTLIDSKRIFLRTKEHPVVAQLEKDGFNYESYDYIYEEEKEFDDVYRRIVSELMAEAKKGEIVYAVPGHPLVAEKTVELLLDNDDKGIEIKILGGQSFLDNMYQALKIDPINGCQIVDGTLLSKEELQIRQHIIVCQVYDAFIASEVKLTLMELLPDDYQVKIVTAAGSIHEEIREVPLYELDRAATLNNLTAVYVPPVREEHLLYRDFHKLREVISILRGPDGCPWDKKQTHQSLKTYLIEEAYEVIEAIDQNDVEHLVEELGDLLLQVVLHAQIGEDDGLFNVDDIVASITEKMIRRHPHVFNKTVKLDENQVVNQWEKIKQDEKGTKIETLLENIPLSFPALSRAYKIQKRAAKVGFDWVDVKDIWLKIEEELTEFEAEAQKNDMEMARKELGDILFSVVNLSRYYNIDPELALQETNRKFQYRFSHIENVLRESGKTFEEVGIKELDEIWEEAKNRS